MKGFPNIQSNKHYFFSCFPILLRATPGSPKDYRPIYQDIYFSWEKGPILTTFRVEEGYPVTGWCGELSTHVTQYPWTYWHEPIYDWLLNEGDHILRSLEKRH